MVVLLLLFVFSEGWVGVGCFFWTVLMEGKKFLMVAGTSPMIAFTCVSLPLHTTLCLPH